MSIEYWERLENTMKNRNGIYILNTEELVWYKSFQNIFFIFHLLHVIFL